MYDNVNKCSPNFYSFKIAESHQVSSFLSHVKSIEQGAVFNWNLHWLIFSKLRKTNTVSTWLYSFIYFSLCQYKYQNSKTWFRGCKLYQQPLMGKEFGFTAPRSELWMKVIWQSLKKPPRRAGVSFTNQRGQFGTKFSKIRTRTNPSFSFSPYLQVCFY